MSAQVLRNRKALCTTTLIVILFTLCWIPYCLYESLVYILREIHVIAFSMAFNKIYRILFLLVLLNSFLDPFIYAARMREIQKGQCRLLAVVAYLGSSLTIHYSAQACERSIAISLSVCLSAREHYLWDRCTDLHETFSANPLWQWLGPPMAALRCYVLPVLWMMSRLAVMGRMAKHGGCCTVKRLPRVTLRYRGGI